MSEAPQPLGWSAGAPVCPNPYWLIAERRRDRLEVLTTRLADGRRVLPVFSFEEEAAIYLRCGIRGSWGVRRTEAGELVSLLCGPCRGVELVALDPISDIESDLVNGFVYLGRKRFVDVLLRGRASAKPLAAAPNARHHRDGLRSTRGR